MWHPLRLAEDTSAPIGRITSFSAKFTDAPLAEGKFETYLPERENSKKPRAVRLSRPQLPMINCSAARRAWLTPVVRNANEIMGIAAALSRG
jgi:hypothetical protein